MKPQLIFSKVVVDYLHLKSKKSNRNGYSIIELLSCILITGLVGLVVSGGLFLCLNSYKKISFKVFGNNLLFQYETAIRNILENTNKIYEAEDLSELVIDSKAVSASGYFDDSDGTIRFKYIISNGSTFESGNDYVEIIPRRQHFFTDKIESFIETELEYFLLEQGQIQVDLTLRSHFDDDFYINESFTVWPDITLLETNSYGIN